jgi:hypothetical protein
MNLLFVLLLSNQADYLSVFKIDQLQAYVMLFLHGFDAIWSMGLIIFGGHLMIVGYLTLKSDSIPKIISILLLVAAIGYIVIHLCYIRFLILLNVSLIFVMRFTQECLVNCDSEKAPVLNTYINFLLQTSKCNQVYISCQ